MRPMSHRLGALGFGFLFQAFVFSGLLHPCCLTGAEDRASHGDAHTTHAAHLAAGHASASAAADAPPPSHNHSSSHDRDGCDGPCGLCCQWPGGAIVPRVDVLAGITLGGTARVAAVLASRGPLPPAPAFLLPFPNGPPAPSVVRA